MQTKTMKTSGDNVQVPPTGGSRPVGHFGVAQGTVRAVFGLSALGCVCNCRAGILP